MSSYQLRNKPLSRIDVEARSRTWSMNHIAIMQSSLLGHPRPPIDKISIMGYTGQELLME